jgi:hypothetical protein
MNVQRPSCKVLVILVRFLIKCEFSLQIFRKYSNIKFRDNSSIGRLDVPSGQTPMTKLIVAFINFANAPKS